MKKIIAAFAALLLVSPAVAQKAKSLLQSEINTNFPDNVAGFVTPSIARSTFSDFLNSWQQYTGVNAQTGTTYTVQASDYGQLVTFNNSATIAVSIPQATGTFASFNSYLDNVGTGNAVLTPTTSTICGSASLTLTSGQGVWIVSDGANYQCWLSNSAYPVTIPSGGTGRTSLTAHSLIVGNAVSPVTMLVGSAGTVWTGQGASADPSATSAPVLGIPGSVRGQIGLAGSTSGTVTIQPQAAAGTATLTLPNASGTVAVQGTAPLTVNTTTGAVTTSAGANTTLCNSTGSTAAMTACNGGQMSANLCTPVRTVLTSGSTATYTVPTCNSAQATWIEVDVQGGGAGGGSSGSTGNNNGTTGNSSIFGGLTAGGGGPGLGGGGAGGAGGTCSGTLGTQQNYPGGAGQGSITTAATNVPGGIGGSGYYGGFGSSAVNVAGGAGPTNSGDGGGGGGSNTTAGVVGGSGGGAGCHIRTLVVSPSSSYTYTVGSAANGGSAGTSGNAGGVGAAGLVDIIAHWQ